MDFEAENLCGVRRGKGKSLEGATLSEETDVIDSHVAPDGDSVDGDGVVQEDRQETCMRVAELYPLGDSPLEYGGDGVGKIPKTRQRKRHRTTDSVESAEIHREQQKQCKKSTKNGKMVSKKRKQGNGEREIDPKSVLWEPPASPYGLVEELLYWDPWKLLVACMLLNKTSGRQVREVLWDLFRMCPSPQSILDVENARILELIRPLGLGNKRTVALKRFSQEYLNKEWRDPIELHGIGQYGSDAYFIFCRAKWRNVKSDDKALKRYVEWLELSDGQGFGYVRDPLPIPKNNP